MEIAVCQAKYDLGIARAKERIENKDDHNLDIKRAELALKRALARIDTFNS